MCTQPPAGKGRNVEQDSARTGKIHHADAISLTSSHATRRAAGQPALRMTPAHEIERVVAGEHPDPHSVLGAHPARAASSVRAFRPGASSVRVVPQKGEPVELARVHEAGALRGRPAGQAHAAAPIASRPATRAAHRSSCATRTRSSRRSASSISTSSPRAATSGSGTRSARTRRRSTATTGTAFAVWAPGARAVGVVGDFNGWNERGAPHAHARRRAASGSCSCPRRPRGTPTSSRSAAPTASCGSRPTRWRCAPSCRRRPARSCTSRALPAGATRMDGAAARRSSRTPGRCRSTRCTSARGG